MNNTSPSQQVREGGEDRPGWRLTLPITLPALDPTRVREHRHPLEMVAMGLSLLILALVIGVGAWREDWLILKAIIAIWFSMVILASQAGTVHTLRGAEVTPTQYPKLYEIFDEVRRQFKAPPTRVFVIRDNRAQAHAYGIRAPYAIVFHSAMIESLQLDELRFVMGQQLGRIIYWQTRMIVPLGGDAEALPSLFAQFTWLRDLVFAWYRRISVLSADRAGALGCQSMEVAVRTLIKLSVGSHEFGELQADDLVDQAYRLNQGMSRVQALTIWITHAEPSLVPRLEKLIAWGGLPKQRAAPTEAAAPPVPLPAGESASSLPLPEPDEGGGR
jgi:Zn-dependent protease with chaperone function